MDLDQIEALRHPWMRGDERRHPTSRVAAAIIRYEREFAVWRCCLRPSKPTSRLNSAREDLYVAMRDHNQASGRRVGYRMGDNYYFFWRKGRRKTLFLLILTVDDLLNASEVPGRFIDLPVSPALN